MSNRRAKTTRRMTNPQSTGNVRGFSIEGSTPLDDGSHQCWKDSGPAQNFWTLVSSYCGVESLMTKVVMMHKRVVLVLVALLVMLTPGAAYAQGFVAPL